MRQGRLLWRICLYFLVATVAALGITTWYAVRSVRNFHEDRVARELRTLAKLISKDVEHYDLKANAGAIDALCKERGKLTDTRITVILPDGLVIGDSIKDPATMDNHANRPEIIQAYRGQIGESSRFSDTLKRTLKYVAFPLREGDSIAAVVRTSQPLAEIRWSRPSGTSWTTRSSTAGTARRSV